MTGGLRHPRIRMALFFVVFLLCGTMPSNADEQTKGVVQLPSGNKVQLEKMGFHRASDGWAVTFSYVSEIDLQNEVAIRSEAAELFRLRLKKVADTTDPKIVAAVLFAYNEPEALDGRIQKRIRNGTVFLRHAEGKWTILPLKEK